MIATYIRIVFTLSLFTGTVSAQSSSDGWYTEGDFTPERRIEVTIANPLDIDSKQCPVVIKREQLPDRHIPVEWITPVDPLLPPSPGPTQKQLKEVGGGGVPFKETNGHYLEYQQDDIDKDGIWDELFFMIDLKARETRTVYLYVGYTERGLYEHRTHAAIGFYARHTVPFWEAEHIGWKLFYPTDVDMHGKREPMLTAYPEYQGNLGGYYMPRQYGTDIMAVGNTFGAGGICLFEVPAYPDSVSRPRFSKYRGLGPVHDTRYAFDVIANGPMRSIIRAKTMNWRTDRGDYELEQLYTAYAHKSYSTCSVRFSGFNPETNAVMFGCGIREVMGEYTTWQKDGVAISFGKNFDPYPPVTYEGSMLVYYKDYKVAFEGIGLVVRDSYKPEYVNTKRFGGNHVMRVPVTPDHSFEYMILGGWSEGAVNTTEQEFMEYVKVEALKFNNPVTITVGEAEQK